jgi:NADPH-dependent 2,4-dienoyl-CoA reductase/sulfur reductase-like enzyme
MTVDLAVIGAGPAGMAAAVAARGLGLSVAVLDEQPAPGGQIWRNVEAAGTGRLGAAYDEGAAVVAAFRASGATYLPGMNVWQVEPDGRVFASDGTTASVITAERVLVAVGAQERAVPIPGWTLPGVMGVGAAQILLKSGGVVPDRPVWIAGQGPLVLLYMTQLLAAGGRIAGWLDTGRPGAWKAALPHLPGALGGWRQLAKGLAWRLALRGVRRVTGVAEVQALGEGRVAHLRWRVGNAWAEAPCDLLLLHEGVVPAIHMALALGCTRQWDAAQACFRPTLDAWGRTDLPRILIAGDCGGVLGATAAGLRGRLAAIAVASDLGGITDAAQRAAPLHAALRAETGLRALLDALFTPPDPVLRPDDAVVLCRCEGVTAGAVRAAVATGAQGPNQVKAFTRAGMGPCQGRICGLPVLNVIAAARGLPPGEIGLARVRPPLKPLTLGELASLPHAPSA